MTIRQCSTIVSVILLAAMTVGCHSAMRRQPTRQAFADRNQSESAEAGLASAYAPVSNKFTLGRSVPIPSASGQTYSPPSEDRVYEFANHEETKLQTTIGRRIVVYTSNHHLIVPEVDAAIEQAKQLAEEMDGFIDSIEGPAISIRVPATQFQEALRRIEAMGRVAHRQIKAADITEQYVDLEARLKSALAVRERLTALLAKAEDVKAAVEVERELARVGAQIESLQAQLEILRDRVAYSTITVTFQTVERSPMPPDTQLPFPWLRELNPAWLTRGY